MGLHGKSITLYILIRIKDALPMFIVLKVVQEFRE